MPYVVLEEKCTDSIYCSQQFPGWPRFPGKIFCGQTKAEDSVVEPLVRCVIESFSWVCEVEIPGDAMV